MITPVQALDIIHANGEVILEDFDMEIYQGEMRLRMISAIGKRIKITRIDSPHNFNRYALVGDLWWPLKHLSPADQPEPAAIELTKEALYARWQYFEKRCELAEKFIKETPCDPDITVSQMTAFQEWNRCKDLGHFTPSVALADFLTLYKGAMSVIGAWDERMPEGKEEYREGFEGMKYWSPASSLVPSKNIADLRAALESIKHLIPQQQ